MKDIFKKSMAFFLILALLLAAVSCGKKDPPDPAEQQEAAVKVSGEILAGIITGDNAPKYETSEAHVSETTAEVHVKVGDRDFVILLTRDADGNWEGEAPKELTEYLEELKKPEQPDNPENPENPENPDNPDNPVTPVNPENPDEPEAPDTPDNPPKEDPEPKEDPKPSEDPKPKHEHKYTSKVTKEATCTKEGVKTYTCSCGDSYTKPIKAKGHSYKDTVVAPTKTAKGYTLHTCTVCGYEYKDKYTNPIGGDTPTPPPVHTHEWEEVYETIHHDEEGHYENRCVEEAWDEPVYETKAVCKVCGKYFDTVDEVINHIQNPNIHDGEGSYTIKDVITRYIHHDAVYEEKWIVDKPAWDEKKLTGYKCKTCGETKGVGGNAAVLPEDKKKKYK